MGGLSDTKVKGKLADGIYGDGGGSQLYLRVQGKARSWLFIYLDAGKRRRTMGLGGYPSVSLKTARVKAEKAREQLGTGKDPIEAKKAVRMVPTFAVCAEEYVRSLEAGWTVGVAKMYRAYLRTHLVDLAGVAIGAVGTSEVEKVLRVVWGTPTGSMVRSFVERVLDFARVKYGLGEGLNPARYRGHLEHVLPSVKSVRVSHPAMDRREVPDFMALLDEHDGVVSRALMLTILGGFRQTEVRELRWREVKSFCENGFALSTRAAQQPSGENVKRLFPCISSARALVADRSLVI